MVKMWYDKYEAEIEDLSEFCALCYDRKLTSAMGGNVSVRVDGGILITASNISLRKITAEYVIMLDMDGNELHNPFKLRPSKETHMHLGAYAARQDVKCVMHLHPPYITAMTAIQSEIPMITESAKGKLGSLPIVPAELPGSDALAKQVHDYISRAAENVHAVALENHGILSFGPSLEDAYNVADLAEDNAKIAYLRKSSGLMETFDTGSNCIGRV